MAAAAIPIVTALGTAVAGSIIAKKMAPKPPPVPPALAEPEPPAVMPIPDDQAMQTARRRAVARRMSSSGRLSTILSDDYAGASGDKLGG